jgi:hypothetical protein
MYFCYVDESGDGGAYNPEKPDKSGSKYFILAGLIVPAKNWKASLDVLKSFKRRIAHQGYLPYDVEFHCSELIDPHKIKEYISISVRDRWMLIEEFAESVGLHGAFSIICVVIDKTISTIEPNEYLTEALTKMYIAFDELLKGKEDNGLLLFDRASEKHISTHARKLLGTGSSGDTIPGVRIGWIIEDPIFRVSADSIFIQSADVIAYSLKEKEFPVTAKKKFNADKIFSKKLLNRCFKSTIGDDNGIIRA